jgi:DNA-binding response OmpR family regulator
MKILVVEDEPSVAMMMTFLLTRVGCEVETAWRANQALALAENSEFDLITLDLSMPGMDGFQLCQRLRQFPHLVQTPIVFVSGSDTEENRRRAIEAGAVDFIGKPFDASSFVDRILSRLEERMPAWS